MNLSLLINDAGYVRMQYGFGQASDERTKTNIKTIENALDKVLLLRGVEYNDIRIEPEIKKIGLISQDVELIFLKLLELGMVDQKVLNIRPLLIECFRWFPYWIRWILSSAYGCENPVRILIFAPMLGKITIRNFESIFAQVPLPVFQWY